MQNASNTRIDSKFEFCLKIPISSPPPPPPPPPFCSIFCPFLAFSSPFPPAFLSASVEQSRIPKASAHPSDAAYVSIRQHTSAYVSIRQHTPAYANIRQHTPTYVSIRQHTQSRSPEASAHQVSGMHIAQNGRNTHIDLIRIKNRTSRFKASYANSLRPSSERERGAEV